MSDRVVNINKGSFDIYIGRKRVGMHYGNPFSHQTGTLAGVKVSTRDEAVTAYREWLAGTAYQDVEPTRRQWILDNLDLLRGKTLGCYCAPKACHGDVLVELSQQ